jgi:uncharacterized protein YbjT (DUF2867 family)
MPKPLTVAVAGATGQQGGAVVRALLGRGHTVRALTRKPRSQAASNLRALGADVRPADLDDGETVERAVEGADAFFLVATPFEEGIQAEVHQGYTAALAAREAGVKHLLYSSVASADRSTGIPHFDSKADVETFVRKLGMPFTIIGPVFFMENLLGPMSLPGLRAGILAMPLPADRPLQMIGVEDIAGFARIVIERRSEFEGKRIDIASDSLTGPAMAATLSNVRGQDIGYRELPLDTLRALNPDFALMWEWFGRTGYSTDIEALVHSHPEVGWHTFQRWAHEQDLGALDEAGPEQPTI